MHIKPLFDRVVLTQIRPKNTTSSGLVLTDTSQEKPLMGEIIEVGDGKNTNDKATEMVVKVGDRVLFSKYAGNVFKLEDKEFIIIRQSDILAVIED